MLLRSNPLLLLAALTAAIVPGLSRAAADDAPAPKPERSIISFTSGPAGSTSVALTFDDGPHPKLTPRLLEILKAEGVPATFFMLGVMVEQNPDIARAVAESGHEIANHSYSHKKLTQVSAGTLEREISETQRLIEEATGVRPTLFRAPYGSVNGAVRQKLLDEDLELVGWAVDPRDWERGATSEGIAAFIVERTQAGSIVLLHDIHERSIDSVAAVIKGLRARGYDFTTAGALIAGKREELKRLAEMPPASATVGLTTASSAAAQLPPAPPPVIPLGQSTLKRYGSSTAAPAAP